MSVTPATDLLKDDLTLIPGPYPSMKQTIVLGLVLFLGSLALHLSLLRFAFYLSVPAQNVAYLTDVLLPVSLVAFYLFTRQKASLSLNMPKGDNLWMLLLIVPALYVQVAFLKHFIGGPFNWSGSGFITSSVWLYCVVFILFLPAIQEFVFRGIVLDGLLRKNPAHIALVAASVVAALPYLYPASMLTYLPVSFFLSWLYYRSRSLVFTYISNAMLSAIPLLLNIRQKDHITALGKLGDLNESAPVLLGAAIVFWVVIIFFNRNILESNKIIN
ncbi:CPBP family glutamic-type intramembrane protease [Chitinophaga sp. 22321]|uniref:CPBP family intramembrane metalloprotease n=1 Tax=Chitinophaga hostae TaxID=2831022 RepID=A0ABS5J057_9BACT|nr:CPBP family glutamic-type intramembrane protease [Chitinophaga hostae]MBS0028624.1 CPBP family intramembrane metalloprotease [Chitinophaga hostae]